MRQARAWNTGSLNEFRKFFGLKPHETFESINSDPEVAANLRHLYEHPDFVEMYPGLVAEEAKNPHVSPGKAKKVSMSAKCHIGFLVLASVPHSQFPVQFYQMLWSLSVVIAFIL